MNPTLNLLCAGAAQGVVRALQARFETQFGCTLNCRFGAVGAMKEALLAGEPCAVMVLTQALIDSLCADDLLQADSRAALGVVLTGVAVRAGTAHPGVATAPALKAALLAADGVYFPDPLRATAQALGCTQVSEIFDTPGVELVGVLPKEFELGTVYTAALATKAAPPELHKLAAEVVVCLTDHSSITLRREAGFVG